METVGIHTKNEILSQPRVWGEALVFLKGMAADLMAFYREVPYTHVVFTGCGSTYYLSLAAASLLQELCGIPARGLPASEIWLSPHTIPPAGRTLLVAVSRSGETTETIRACQNFLENGRGDLITLTCVPESKLAGLGRVNLVFPFAMEQSIAQTRAFSTLYLGTVFLAALWAGDNKLLVDMERLPEAGMDLLRKCNDQAVLIGRNPDYDRFYFLGSGPRYGLACELSLKMKEMSLSHSEPFHFLEFRHGPQSMVNETTVIVGLLSEANHAQESAVLEEMAGRGVRVYSLGEVNAECSFASGIQASARNVLYLPIGQMLAFERALSRGLDPDRPHNLDAVVKLRET